MRALVAGSQVIHKGAAVQLLYRKLAGPLNEIWRVRPLFVERPKDRDELFTFADRVSPIHGAMLASRCRIRSPRQDAAARWSGSE